MTTPPSRFITERRLPGTSRHLTNRVYRDQHKFIAPVRDCLTSCLRALIYFPLTVAARSNSVYLPQPCPPFFCSSHTYMHAWGGGGDTTHCRLVGACEELSGPARPSAGAALVQLQWNADPLSSVVKHERSVGTNAFLFFANAANTHLSKR